MTIALIPLAIVSSQHFTDFMEHAFGGDAPSHPLSPHQVAARAAIVYIVGVVVIRVGKSRLISRVTALDVIVGFILGSLLSRAITGSAPISGTAIATVALVATHWLFTAIAYRSHTFGNLIKGRVKPLILDGKLYCDNMRQSHISNADLMEQLRLRGIADPREVIAAYKERNGEVSVIPRRDGHNSILSLDDQITHVRGLQQCTSAELDMKH